MQLIHAVPAPSGYGENLIGLFARGAEELHEIVQTISGAKNDIIPR